ncbi:MAG: protein-disulfide reductase DsbD domain-containing protein [Chitinophagaceae bacterium]
MKKFFLGSLLLLAPFFLQAQILRPVKWQYAAVKLSQGNYALHLKATIDPGWHIYAIHAGDGPVSTSFKFPHSPGVTLVGSVREEGKMIKKYDKNFQSILRYFEHTVDFVQEVRVRPGIKHIQGSLVFMVCNDRNCLPPTNRDFFLPLN